MTDHFDRALAERFRALANPLDDSNWLEVRRRAARSRRSSPRRSRPLRLALLVAALALAALLAAPGLGIGSRFVDLFTGAPAPEKVKEDVAALDVDAPAGETQGVRAGETVKLVEIPTSSGRPAVLWIAPTKGGGWCWSVTVGGEDGWAGCNPTGVHDEGSIGGTSGEAARGIVLLCCYVPRGTASLEVHFEDGLTVPIELVRGFFLYQVPPDRLIPARRPTALIARDQDDVELARAEL